MGTSAITGAPLPDFVQIQLPPQTPPPNTTTWGEGLQHMNMLRGHQQIIHSRRKSIRGKEGGREREKKKQEMVGMEKTRGHQGLGPEMRDHHRKFSPGPQMPPHQKRRRLTPGFNQEPPLQTLPQSYISHKMLDFLKPKRQLVWHSAP